ncbi:hxlR-like helix-turn-helix family protein [Mycobacteroides abscessus MAB_030201_1075]|nr:putative transcriptional regulator [Mycobacteroides abscessus 4S-0726-RA]EIV07751.1 putative transcriptional regulator [Mycobacteroides abscessus 4S-0206]EIV47314.1 putative transcriptional regulator [Mycobacteroides abscessus 4S-0116-R]ETZ69318.1 hxlR-like helix-turn-helix family protein [Mycobacteroides abscessus MAB_110811_1470]ETZ86652.1 hxlR-like helix-turn-helix family protein [Mycobacteroides abscessus MAB_030201_1075]
MAMGFERPLRDRSRWNTDACSIGKALDLLSTKTAFLIVRECFYGSTRFDEFAERIGVSAPAVSRALKQLEAAGVIEKVPYREPGQRERDGYVLTRMGEDLLPVLLSLLKWGDDYLQDGHKPLTLIDKKTGGEIGVQVTSRPGQAVSADGIEVRVARR